MEQDTSYQEDRNQYEGNDHPSPENNELEEAKNNYELQCILVEKSLKDFERKNRLPVKAHQIRGWVSENYPEHFKKLEVSWQQYLSTSVSDPNTRVSRTPGQYTYTLHDPEQGIETETEGTEEASVEEKRAYERREKKLYRPLVQWFQSKGYRAEVTSENKKGNVWGNPDLTGIEIIEGILGKKDIEIATVEAKPSAANWRKWFFEAVAHKRFSHRAYFAFAHGTDEPNIKDVPDYDELREYGEKYGVGVVVIFMPKDTYNSLLYGAGVDQIDLDELRVEEIWPAIFESIRPSSKTNFIFNSLGITKDDEIYQFGMVK